MIPGKIRYMLCLLGMAFYGHAQLLVSSNSSASTLVGQIVDNNVIVTNPVIHCNSAASGLFISNGSNIGLSSGILLSTGRVQDAMGPNNNASAGVSFSGSPSSVNFSDPDIQAIIPNAQYDGCVLEFDIKPYCNKIQIKYVFGSEEYPEFSVPQSGGGTFYDVFGFFVTGPNPGGGSYNGYNIARLGNGSQVSINSINNGSNNTGPCHNCQFYVDNTGGSTVQYDGFTTPLTASVNVVPCSTYHLKLAIADAGDGIYDSGVFLEYKGIGCASNSSPALTTATTVAKCDLNNGTAQVTVANSTGPLSYTWTPGNQHTATATGLAPGDYTCTVGFQLPCPYTETVSVTVPHDPGFTFTTSITNIKCPQDANGSATITVANGTSPYTYSWNTNPSQTTNVAHNLSLGQYVATISDASGCVKKDTVKIFATTTLSASPVATDALCGNPTGSINANATGGVPAYTYTWTTTPVQHSATAGSLLPGTYSVTVEDQDGCRFTTGTTVNNFTPTITFADSVINTTCQQQNGAIYINAVNGGTAPYTYTWTSTPVQNTPSATGLVPGTYTVSVRDANNCPATASYTLVNYGYLPTVAVKKDDKCDQKKGTVEAVVLGGSPGFTYAWNDGQTTQTATGLGAGKYWVDIIDAAGCKSSDTILIENHNDVFNGNIILDPNEPVVNEPFTITLHPTSVWNLSYAFVGGDGRITSDTANTFNYQDYGFYNITYYLVSNDGCRDTLKYDFFVKDFMTIYVPNTFTPNGDNTNDIFLAKGTLVREFHMYIFDRWGQLTFKSDDINKGWDGYYKGTMAPIDTYVYKIMATDYFNREQTFVGHVNLIR